MGMPSKEEAYIFIVNILGRQLMQNFSKQPNFVKCCKQRLRRKWALLLSVWLFYLLITIS